MKFKNKNRHPNANHGQESQSVNSRGVESQLTGHRRTLHMSRVSEMPALKSEGLFVMNSNASESDRVFLKSQPQLISAIAIDGTSSTSQVGIFRTLEKGVWVAGFDVQGKGALEINQPQRLEAGAPLVLGRGENADYRLPVDDETLSREHVVVTKNEYDSITIEDTSTNHGVSIVTQELQRFILDD